MSPEQCRMARTALRWSTKNLAEVAGVNPMTVNSFESGKDAYTSTDKKLQAAMEDTGSVIFGSDNSVRCTNRERCLGCDEVVAVALKDNGTITRYFCDTCTSHDVSRKAKKVILQDRAKKDSFLKVIAKAKNSEDFLRVTEERGSLKFWKHT